MPPLAGNFCLRVYFYCFEISVGLLRLERQREIERHNTVITLSACMEGDGVIVGVVWVAFICDDVRIRQC